MFTVVLNFLKLLVLVACITSPLNKQLLPCSHAASFMYAINLNTYTPFHVFRFVATPFVESNVQAMKVKQMQDELKEMETKAVDLNIPKGSPVERGVHHFTIYLEFLHENVVF